jgi:hypothetical protein
VALLDVTSEVAQGASVQAHELAGDRVGLALSEDLCDGLGLRAAQVAKGRSSLPLAPLAERGLEGGAYLRG